MIVNLHFRRLPAMLLLSLLLACPALAEAALEPVEAAVEALAPVELNEAEATPDGSADWTVDVGSGKSLTVCAGDTLDVTFTRAPLASLASSRPSVLEIERYDLAAGTARVVARGTGSAKLTARTTGKRTVRLTVKVVARDKPTGIRLPVRKLTLNAGESYALVPTVTPATAAPALTWKSSKPGIADVDGAGVVTAVAGAEGTAKITVRTGNGRRAGVSVHVVNPNRPTSARFEPETLTLAVNETSTPVPVLVPDTAQTVYTWKSSRSSVASVDAAGKITGKKPGTAKITATTANKKKAVLKVTVVKGAETRCRALLVANDSFYWGGTRGWERTAYNKNAANSLKDALGGVTGEDGQDYAVTVRTDVTRAGLKSAVAEAFAEADDDDVSLFYFASHGDSKSTDASAGALAMASVDETYPEYVKLSEIAAMLSAVPGKVIVMLDTCGSGAGVYAKDGDSTSAEKACADFDRAVVDAFRKADPGIEVAVEEGGAVAKTGELRVENKFYVLCSSNYLELSWAYGGASGGGSFFTDWVVAGIGKSGKMPADTQYAGNRDGAVDLYELFSYVSNTGDKTPIYSSGEYSYQHVQVYPADTRYLMFR